MRGFRWGWSLVPSWSRGVGARPLPRPRLSRVPRPRPCRFPLRPPSVLPLAHRLRWRVARPSVRAVGCSVPCVFSSPSPSLRPRLARRNLFYLNHHRGLIYQPFSLRFAPPSLVPCWLVLVRLPPRSCAGRCGFRSAGNPAPLPRPRLLLVGALPFCQLGLAKRHLYQKMVHLAPFLTNSTFRTQFGCVSHPLRIPSALAPLALRLARF